VSKIIEQGEHKVLTRLSSEKFNVVCSWCGEVIRSNAAEGAERMCLICHARMLNDYFQRLHKSDGSKQNAYYRRRKEAD
jgi:hypothetical protein